MDGKSRSEAIDAAARELVAARSSRRPLARLPAIHAPWDIEAALQVQTTVGSLLRETVAGWKCGLPSPGRLVVAPIFGSLVAQGPHWRLPIAGHGKARLEPEVAVIIARDLPPRDRPYEDAEVRDAVGAVRLAIELVECRYVDPEQVDFAELLADGLFNAGLFLGPKVSGGLACELGRMTITLATDGEPARELAGHHPNQDPLRPLHWLANHLRERGLGLQRGQAVITGSYAGVLDVPSDARLRIGFGELGAIAIQLSTDDARNGS